MQGQSGESTTAVVQRYMKMQPGQEAPFSARVYLFSLEQIRALMASMVNKWYVNSTVETEVAQQTDEEEEAARHCERTIVLDTCLALLGDTEYFFDEEHATASLNAAESEHDGRMIECLSGMTLDAVSLGSATARASWMSPVPLPRNCYSIWNSTRTRHLVRRARVGSFCGLS